MPSAITDIIHRASMDVLFPSHLEHAGLDRRQHEGGSVIIIPMERWQTHGMVWDALFAGLTATEDGVVAKQAEPEQVLPLRFMPHLCL